MQANINVRAIAQGCSEYNITVVVKREDCIKALRAVHSRFYLSRTTIAMGIIGPGLIGSTLLEQLSDQVLLFLFFWINFLIFFNIFSLPSFIYMC
jgi:aspartokinase/homoserine dehydrogenase 1